MEIELDHIGTLEVEAMEGMRRANVGHIERRVMDAKHRLIRIERSKWKTDAIRLKVIQRNREGYQKIVKAAQEGRDMNYARTVSFETRQKRRDYEELREAEMHRLDGLAQTNTAAGYESYAQPVQETFDSIVAGNLSMLRGVTLEERAARVKKQYSNREKAKVQKRGGQFSSLKNGDHFER